MQTANLFVLVGGRSLATSVLRCNRHGRHLRTRNGTKLDSGNLAYFRFCKDCHKQHWPSDMRQQGPSCKPAAPVWAKWRDDADGVCKLFSGDFFLTRAPPDFSLTWILPCLWSGLSQGAAAFVNTFPVGILCLYGGVWMYCLYPQM